MTVCHPTGRKVALLAGFLLCKALWTGAQVAGIELQTRVDRRAIRLGDPAVLMVTMNLSPGTFKDVKAIWPDTLQRFEWLAPPRTDTSVSDGRIRISFTRPFTSFDSGRWTLPPIALVVDGRSLRSDTLGMDVGTMTLTGDEYRDIGDILDEQATPTGMPPFGYAAIAGLMLAVLMAWLYIRRRRSATVLFKTPASPDDAYGEAMLGLDRLLGEMPSGGEATRAFHASLYGLLRGYLRKAHGWEVSSLTTGDLLALVSRHCPDREMLSRLAAVLRLSDAVRFARRLPPTEDSFQCVGELRSFIRFLHENGPHQ
jgi:hypothetical protein